MLRRFMRLEQFVCLNMFKRLVGKSFLLLSRSEWELTFCGLVVFFLQILRLKRMFGGLMCFWGNPTSFRLFYFPNVHHCALSRRTSWSFSTSSYLRPLKTHQKTVPIAKTIHQKPPPKCIPSLGLPILSPKRAKPVSRRKDQQPEADVSPTAPLSDQSTLDGTLDLMRWKIMESASTTR